MPSPQPTKPHIIPLLKRLMKLHGLIDPVVRGLNDEHVFIDYFLQVSGDGFGAGGEVDQAYIVAEFCEFRTVRHGGREGVVVVGHEDVADVVWFGSWGGLGLGLGLGLGFFEVAKDHSLRACGVA